VKIFTAAELHPELSASQVQITYLVQFQFSAINIGFEDLFFTTNSHTLFALGQEWLGAGRMLEITLPSEDATLEVHAGEISLDGLNPTVISLALNVPIEGTPVIIYIVCLDPNTNQMVNPVWTYLRGTISEVRIVPPSVTTQL
jgi:hypothetical protein